MAKIVDPDNIARPTARLVGGPGRMPAPGPSLGKAEGLQALASDLGQGAEVLYRAQKIEEDRINGLRAEDAFNQLRQRQLDLTFGEQNGFSRLKGAEAVSRPIVPEFQKRFDDARREVLGTLTNDDQRQRFNKRADLARMQYDEELLRHLSKEGDVYAKQVYEGTIAQALQDAVVRWDSPADVAGSLARIQNSVRDRAERYQWPAEYRQAVLKEESSKVHKAVIGQALATGDYGYAQRWYEANKDGVDASTAQVLQRAVQDGSQKEMAAGFTSDFLANRDNRKALVSLSDQVLKSELDETRKNIVYGRILNRIDSLDVRAERERLQHERQVSRLIDDANGNTFAGMPSTVEQLMPVYEAAKGTPLEGDARQMVAVANATGGFAKLPPAAQADAISQAENQVRKDPGKFDRRLLTAWKEIYRQQDELRKKDPVTLAARQGTAEPIPVDLSDPIGSADALASRFALVRGLQARDGSPNRPLTEQEANLVSRSLERASWRDKRDYLGKIFQASRGDLQGYMGIMSQLAEDHPVTAIAGAAAGQGRAQNAELMLRGEQILRPVASEDGKPDSGALLPMPSENDMRAGFDSYVREAFAGKAKARSDHYQASRAIYAALSVDAGDKDTKVLDSDRWEQAIQLAIGPVEKYNGRRVIMPHGYTEGMFKDGIRDRVELILERSSRTASQVVALEGSLTPGEKAIVQYHRNTISSGQVGRDEAGRPVTVYSTGIQIPEGKHKGKFVAVPGYVDGKIERSEDALYQRWKKDIEAGKWPMYSSGEELNRRSREIHGIMDLEGGSGGARGVLDASWTPDRLRELPLENIRGQQYVFRVGDGVLTDRAGYPVILDFGQGLPFKTSGYGRSAPAGEAPTDMGVSP